MTDEIQDNELEMLVEKTMRQNKLYSRLPFSIDYTQASTPTSKGRKILDLPIVSIKCVTPVQTQPLFINPFHSQITQPGFIKRDDLKGPSDNHEENKTSVGQAIHDRSTVVGMLH